MKPKSPLRLFCYLIIICVALLWAQSGCTYAAAGRPGGALGDTTQLRAVTPAGELDGLPGMVVAVIRTVDAVGGPLVDDNMAVVIVGVGVILMYALLRAMLEKAKLPADALWARLAFVVLSALFGKESTWKNRIFTSKTPLYERTRQKSKLLGRLRKDYPIIRDDIDMVISGKTYG